MGVIITTIILVLYNFYDHCSKSLHYNKDFSTKENILLLQWFITIAYCLSLAASTVLPHGGDWFHTHTRPSAMPVLHQRHLKKVYSIIFGYTEARVLCIQLDKTKENKKILLDVIYQIYSVKLKTNTHRPHNYELV